MEHEENSSGLVDTGDFAGDGAGDIQTNTRRTYDCSFCKRGFTNAQALGGHMNIHRKERSKSKRYLSSSSSSSSSFSPATDYSNPNLTAPPMSPPPFYPVIESCEGGVYTYDNGGFLHARGNRNPNPRGHFGRFYGENDHEEFLGVDLSLGLRSMHFVDDESRRRSSDEGSANAGANDLDLELRLGHNNR